MTKALYKLYNLRASAPPSKADGVSVAESEVEGPGDFKKHGESHPLAMVADTSDDDIEQSENPLTPTNSMGQYLSIPDENGLGQELAEWQEAEATIGQNEDSAEAIASGQDQLGD